MAMFDLDLFCVVATNAKHGHDIIRHTLTCQTNNTYCTQHIVLVHRNVSRTPTDVNQGYTNITLCFIKHSHCTCNRLQHHCIDMKSGTLSALVDILNC